MACASFKRLTEMTKHCLFFSVKGIIWIEYNIEFIHPIYVHPLQHISFPWFDLISIYHIQDVHVWYIILPMFYHHFMLSSKLLSILFFIYRSTTRQDILYNRTGGIGKTSPFYWFRKNLFCEPYINVEKEDHHHIKHKIRMEFLIIFDNIVCNFVR